jgi:NAD(P)-dependent dehydrogenase (short-subunit alcohol dehydrogenase family)
VKKTTLVTGSTRNLEKRICKALIEEDANVRASVCNSTDSEKIEALEKLGVKVVEIDMKSVDAIANACEGVT